MKARAAGLSNGENPGKRRPLRRFRIGRGADWVHAPGVLPALTGYDPAALEAYLAAEGQPAFRAKQILDWIWKKKADSVAAMSNLPAALREKLADAFRLHALEPARTQGSADTTRKFLFKLHDGRYGESVLIPAHPAL